MGRSKKANMELEVSASGSLKCKTWVLKVAFHCDGCKRQVKQALQKLKGVYEVKLDSEQGKVTVVGNVSSDTLLKKLLEKGKHAEIIADNSTPVGKPNQLRPVVKHANMFNHGSMEEEAKTNARYYSNNQGSATLGPYSRSPQTLGNQGSASLGPYIRSPQPGTLGLGPYSRSTQTLGNQGSASLGPYSRSPQPGTLGLEPYSRSPHPGTLGNQGSASLGPYSRSQQRGTSAATNYGHGHGNVVPNNMATGLGTQQCLGGSGSSRVINRQYSTYANKVSSAPAQVTGWANTKPTSKNQWVAYDQTAHRHHGHRAHTIIPTHATALRASSNASRLSGYSDHYIPSQPSAYSDQPEKSKRRSRSAHTSNNTSLDIFSEENPNACSIM